MDEKSGMKTRTRINKKKHNNCRHTNKCHNAHAKNQTRNAHRGKLRTHKTQENRTTSLTVLQKGWDLFEFDGYQVIVSDPGF